jgi:hypothetical protein
MLVSGAVSAQDAQKPAPVQVSPEAAPAAPEEGGPPPLNSPWRSYDFDLPFDRLKAEVFTLIRGDGLTLQSPDDASGPFLTGLIAFDDKRFNASVSVPPPRASAKYPYFQLIEMRAGRYGLEGRLTPIAASRTRLELRAMLEIQAMDKKENHLRWVPRYSNGTVEQDFFNRLNLAILAANSSPQPAR